MVVGLGKFGLRWIVDRAPIYSYVLHELESILQKSSNQLQLTQFNNWSEVNQLAKNQKPAGIFFIGNAPDGENSSIPTGVPCVQIMGRLPSPLIDHVAPDHRRVWRTAAEWLIGHGHRHCAVISEAGLSLDLVTHEFAHLMQSSGGASHRFSDPDLVRIAADRHETNAAVIASFVDRIVKLEPRPTAIVSAMDILTPPIYQELRQHGIRPQEDIAIVSINNETPYLTSLNPKPIAIDLQPHDIALQAVQQLAWRRQHPEAACTRSLVAPKLIEPPA
ncbi:MAG: substrate-binding domain-containing protein [Planctomycetota bacterium]